MIFKSCYNCDRIQWHLYFYRKYRLYNLPVFTNLGAINSCESCEGKFGQTVLSVLLKLDSYEHQLAAKTWYGRLTFKQNVRNRISTLLEHLPWTSK